MLKRILAVALVLLLALGPMGAGLAEHESYVNIEAEQPGDEALFVDAESEQVIPDENVDALPEEDMVLGGEDLVVEGELSAQDTVPVADAGMDLADALSDALQGLPDVDIPMPASVVDGDEADAPVEPAPKAETEYVAEASEDAELPIPDDVVTLVIDDDAQADPEPEAGDGDAPLSQDTGELSGETDGAEAGEAPDDADADEAITDEVSVDAESGEPDDKHEAADANEEDEDAGAVEEADAPETAEEAGDGAEAGDGEDADNADKDDPEDGETGEDGQDLADVLSEETGDPEEAPEVAEAPDSTVTLSSTKLTVGVGESLTLKAGDTDPDGGKITWKSADKKLAKVNSAGVVTGVKAGTVTVSATNAKGALAECTVIVKKAPTKVTLSPATLNVGLNEKVQLAPRVNSGSACSTYKWETSDKTIVKVTRQGLITGVKKGKAKIRVTTYNGKQYIQNIVVTKAATGIQLSLKQRKLGVGQSFTLSATAKPANSAVTPIYSTSDPSVAQVNARTGKVTAKGVGECDIIASTYFAGVTDTCHITVYGAPKKIAIDSGVISLYLSGTKTHKLASQVRLTGETEEEAVYSDLTFTSSNTKAATVSAGGRITGKGRGRATITVSTYNGLSAKVLVKVYVEPSKVTLTPNSVEILINETKQLTAKLPAYSYPREVEFTSSNRSVATVDANGLVTAGKKRGTATITAKTVNGKTAKTTVRVMDPNYPERAKITKKPTVMDVGETYQVKGTVVPSSANPKFRWTSADPSVVKVNKYGKLTAVNFGVTTITAQSTVNPKIKLSFKVRVWVKNLTLTIPGRTTKLSAGTTPIKKNLNKIEAVRKSAIWMIDWHRKKGQISASDANKRKSIINNAFKDYAFPWITLKYQDYWKARNSEGGRKDFKPGTVYYGIPYNSDWANRTYNKAKALGQNRYYGSGKGYYILNQKNLVYGSYCGSDCSGFVDAAIWGTGSTHSADRTWEIAESGAYRTVSFASMRPGDLICKGHAHVVMFLYYTNPQRTKIMMIENGGAELGTNTVHCDIYNLSYYTSRGYRVRRLASLN